MKANELMIGDWVAFQGHPYRMNANDIASIADCEARGVPTDLSEIPLTPEILEKNGWECFDTYDKYIHYRHPKAPFDILQRKDGGYTIEVGAVEGGAVFLFIRYVHELQHALRLCGIEKEIIL